MKRSLFCLFLFLCIEQTAASERAAYYTYWRHNSTALQLLDLDTTITWLLHFAMGYTSAGLVNNGEVSLSQISEVVSWVHGKGRKVSFVLGGASTIWDGTWEQAMSPANAPTFVSQMAQFMNTYNYDGVDLDYENGDWSPTNATNFNNLVTRLRDTLDARWGAGVKKVTCYAGGSAQQIALYSPVIADLDMLWVQGYDFSGAWPGWITWHNGPLYDGGQRFPSTNGLVPSIDSVMSDYKQAGVPVGKLAVGFSCGALIWGGGGGTPTGGVTAPRQSYTTNPWAGGDQAYWYWKGLYGNYAELWDDTAKQGYVSIDLGADADDRFISFDNGQTIIEKQNYSDNTLGGSAFMWDANAAYMSSFPSDHRFPLILSWKQAVQGTPPSVGLTVVSPNGGETWYQNQTRNITWNTDIGGDPPTVKIESSTNNGSSWTTETASTPNDGLYAWTVPEVVTAQALIRISDATDGVPIDQSNAAFSIAAPVVSSGRRLLIKVVP